MARRNTKSYSNDIERNAAEVSAALACEHIAAPSHLTEEQRALFDNIVRSKTAAYWNDSDIHLVAHYCELWTQYMSLHTQIMSGKKLNGGINRALATERNLFSRCDKLLLRIGVSPAQRVEQMSRFITNEKLEQKKRETDKALHDGVHGNDRLIAAPASMSQ